MKHYDNIVAGSGASGLTAALLLAMAGRRVLIVEKAPVIGGSLVRFDCEGVPFDTGFHFTGGLEPGGMFHRMLGILGLQARIAPVFLSKECAQEILFEHDGSRYRIPSGTSALVAKFEEYFPEDIACVKTYFDKVCSIFGRTAHQAFGLSDQLPAFSEEDYVSLQAFLDGSTSNRKLQAMLSIFCMCYGVRPDEISFANHSRVCCGLFESLARIEGGGASLVEAFSDKLEELGVEVRTGTAIARCGDSEPITKAVM